MDVPVLKGNTIVGPGWVATFSDDLWAAYEYQNHVPMFRAMVWYQSCMTNHKPCQGHPTSWVYSRDKADEDAQWYRQFPDVVKTEVIARLPLDTMSA